MMAHDRDGFIFIDSHGDIWRLQPTGDPGMPITISLLERVPIGGQGHRCSGCGHRWDGALVGAELCGDCWRKAQPVVHR